MSNQVIVERSTLPASDLTYAKAKAVVARTIGDETDARSLGHAGDALRMAVADWNRRHQFEWNVLDAFDISVTAGTSSYDLPSDFLHMHSVRMIVNERPLMYLRQRLYDRASLDQNERQWSTHYTLFGSGQSGQITLIPIPSEDDTCRLRYYAGVSIPTTNESLFGLPERHVWGLIYKAKALILMDRDAENIRAQMWNAEAERAFVQAREDDIHREDEDRRMIPQIEHGHRGYSETHAYANLEYD